MEQGEDNVGTTYSDINEFWKRELQPEKAELESEELKIEGRIGSVDNWYAGQVKYWDVMITNC